ncbi:hypothetical protein [Dactylosporangium sp. NPDC051541]|uniref:hypothetical protein n=1 Tax=Dactylosporangium sp. NPDC051541 TaxID=3363977 RepID=UPI0037ACB220
MSAKDIRERISEGIRGSGGGQVHEMMPHARVVMAVYERYDLRAAVHGGDGTRQSFFYMTGSDKHSPHETLGLVEMVQLTAREDAAHLLDPVRPV